MEVPGRVFEVVECLGDHIRIISRGEDHTDQRRGGHSWDFPCQRVEICGGCQPPGVWGAHMRIDLLGMRGLAAGLGSNVGPDHWFEGGFVESAREIIREFLVRQVNVVKMDQLSVARMGFPQHPDSPSEKSQGAPSPLEVRNRRQALVEDHHQVRVEWVRPSDFGAPSRTRHALG